VAVVQYTFTHKQYKEQHNKQLLVGRLSGIRTHSGETKINDALTVSKLSPNGNSAGRTPSSRVTPWHFALQLSKKHGKTSVTVAEKCQFAR
jgi:hypothetical protein